MDGKDVANQSVDEEQEEKADHIADRLREQEIRQFGEKPQAKVHHSLHKTAKPPLRMQNRTITNRPQAQSHG